jgi:chromosome segregation ATPase
MSEQNASSLLSELKSLVSELRKYQADVNSVKRNVSVTSALKTKKEQTLKTLDARLNSEEKSLSEALANVYQSMVKFGRDNYPTYEALTERLDDIRDNFSNFSKAGKVTKSQQMSFDGLVKTIEGGLENIVFSVEDSNLWSDIVDTYINRQEELEYNQSMYVRYYDSLKELLSTKISKVSEYQRLMDMYKKDSESLSEELEKLEDAKMRAEENVKGLNLESLKKESVSIPSEMDELKKVLQLLQDSMKLYNIEISRLSSLLGDDTDDLTDEQINIDILAQQELLDSAKTEESKLSAKAKELSKRLSYVNNAIENFRVVLVEAQQNLKRIISEIAKAKSEFESLNSTIDFTEATHKTYMSDLESDVNTLFDKIIKLTDWLEEATKKSLINSDINHEDYTKDLGVEYAKGAELNIIKSHPYREAWFKFKSAQLQYVVLTDSFEIEDAVKLYDSTNKAIRTLLSLVDSYNKSNEILANNKSESCDKLYPMMETLGGYTETMSRIQNRLDEINDFTSSYETNLADLEADLTSNNEWIANLQSEKAEYEESFSVAQAAIANLDTESETYADDLANLEAEIDSLNDSISSVDGKISEAQEKSTAIQSDKDNLQAENESMISEKATLEADYNNVKAENENQLSSLMDNIYGVSERLAKTNSELGIAEAGIKENEAVIENFNDYMRRNPWELWFMYEEKSSEEGNEEAEVA